MRLAHRALTPAPEFTFTFNGAPVVAREGESIAAALAASGIVALRIHADGSPRGQWCGMGACFDCLVTIDGRARQRACMAKAEPGSRVSGTPPEEPAPLASVPGVPPPEHACDVAVVGAGPAGLTAARCLGKAGLSVLLLDERAEAGGQYYKPLVASHALRPLDRQFAAGARLRRAVASSGARVWQDASVWGAFDELEGLVLGVLCCGRSYLVRPRRLLLAPGAYERPVPIPGWTLPGVMTTGAAQTLARGYRVAPGRRVVIGGNGALNIRLAAELCRAGVRVLAVAEEAARPRAAAVLRALRHGPGWMAQGAADLLTLRRHGVPVLWGGRVAAAEGDDRVDACLVDTPDGRHRFKADTVVLGHGFVPATDLARQLGCRHEFADRHVGYLETETAVDGCTSRPDVFAVGDGARFGGAQVARHRAVLAARAIVHDLGGSVPHPGAAARALRRADRFQDALWTLFRAPAFDPAAITDDTPVCRCEGVSAGRVRAVMEAAGADAGTVKRLTRFGMGACGGRNCAAVLARMVAAAGGAAPGPFAFFAPRPAAKPVPLAALAVEQPEWGGHRRSTPPAAVPRPRRARAAWTGQRADVLVIGAGVVGTCVARELAQAGIDVLVVDRDTPGQQASTANAGSLHVQLLSFDFGAKAEAGGQPAAETLRLGAPAIALWREIEREAGADLGLRLTGGLMLAETEAELAFLRSKAALEARYGVETAVIGGNELRALEPALSPHMIGAAFCAAEGKIDPLAATFAVLNQARHAGARFEADAPVQAIERDGPGWRVITAAGPVCAGRIVNCAGAWASRIAAMAARPIPVSGAPLQMLVTEPGSALISRLIAHAGRHLSLKQTAGGALLIGGGWSADLNPATGASRALRWAIEGNAWVACRVLPAAAGFTLLRVWAGMNIDIDGAPILGEMPGAPGFYNCVTSNGYTLAPIVARLTAQTMLRGSAEKDTRPFTLDRF